MDKPSMREPLMLFATTDAATSTGELELGRPRASQISESVDGAEESVGPRQVDHADGVVETE